MPLATSVVSWVKLVVLVLAFVLTGIWVQMMQPSKAEALLGGLLDPIVETVSQEEQSPEELSSKEDSSGQPKLSVPSLSVNMPILRVETPEVSVSLNDSKGLSAEASSLVVDTPILQADVSGAAADVKLEDAIAPTIELKTPSINVAGPVGHMELTPVAVSIEGDETIPSAVEVELPKVDVATPVVDLHTPEPIVSIKPEIAKPEPTIEPSPELPDDREDVTSEQPLPEAPEELAPREESSTEPSTGKGSAVSAETTGSVAIVNNQGTTEAGEEGAPQPKPPLPSDKPASAPKHIVAASSGTAAGSGSAGPGTAGWTAPWTILQSQNEARKNSTVDEIIDLYRIRSDQWSQAPPGRPPMHAFFSHKG